MPISIILVQPEIPENIGFIARSMKCYNQESLYIVGRRKLTPMSRAYKTGSSAVDILDNVQYHKSLADALKPFHMALGFTRRNRAISNKRVCLAHDTLPAVDFSLNVALVFGCESQGLSKEDCMLMNKLIRIVHPNTDFCFNLSHAVTVVLHEIFTHGIATHNPMRTQSLETPDTEEEPNTQHPLLENREDTFQTFLQLLERKKVFKNNKAAAHVEYLRDLWQRASPDQNEMTFLLGLVSRLVQETGLKKHKNS
jgi:tRNA/rRNA methyltransferase